MLDPDVVARLLGHRHDPLGSLTPKEREVVSCTAESCTIFSDRHRHGREYGSDGERGYIDCAGTELGRFG